MNLLTQSGILYEDVAILNYVNGGASVLAADGSRFYGHFVHPGTAEEYIQEGGVDTASLVPVADRMKKSIFWKK